MKHFANSSKRWTCLNRSTHTPSWGARAKSPGPLPGKATPDSWTPNITASNGSCYSKKGDGTLKSGLGQSTPTQGVAFPLFNPCWCIIISYHLVLQILETIVAPWKCKMHNIRVDGPTQVCTWLPGILAHRCTSSICGGHGRLHCTGCGFASPKCPPFDQPATGNHGQKISIGTTTAFMGWLWRLWPMVYTLLPTKN